MFQVLLPNKLNDAMPGFCSRIAKTTGEAGCSGWGSCRDYKRKQQVFTALSSKKNVKNYNKFDPRFNIAKRSETP